MGTPLVTLLLLGTTAFWTVTCALAAEKEPTPPGENQQLDLRVSWGHESRTKKQFNVKLLANNISISSLLPLQFEPGDAREGVECQTTAGAGDVDTLEVSVVFPIQKINSIRDVHSIWRYLLDHSDADTARRLRSDPALRPDGRKLTFQLNREGTSGFTLTADQMLEQRNFWIPDLDLFVAVGERPAAFADYRKRLQGWQGKRTLAQLDSAPEATYEQYANHWEDMGNPAYQNPHSAGPGHIVGLTWDSALAKFGVDRGANVWNDLGNSHHFHLGFDFGVVDALTNDWRGQQLVGGLPIILTQFERQGVRYEIEQFAYPLNGPPRERRGDLPMVLFESVRLTDLTGQARHVSLNLAHRRETPGTNSSVVVETSAQAWWWRDQATQSAWLMLQGSGVVVKTNSVHPGRWTTNRITLSVNLAAGGSLGMVIKLPSAPVPAAQVEQLAELDFATARDQTKRFWSDYLARGAQFSVPEESVNTLFRANLWHALRLPRRHEGRGTGVKLDLPYSNFAYGQQGTPWPVNQAVYVDYMLYDLRGYHEVSAEELGAIYRNNQQADGRVGGFANWGVYTPGMIYSVAQHYLLAGDRASFETLLPPTLRALDWCLSELQKASARSGEAPGLVLAPLNDLSHEPKAWAFNQAYLYAGIDLLGHALKEIGHPRARDCQAAARAIADAIRVEFGRASMRSPLVQLRDHTWIPYVPGDALSPSRRLDLWYPTDVDCGALHLSRLKALDPKADLTWFLLLDHEDNLFLKHLGMANEPVYNQHATAYLQRDEPKAAIRAFYSMLACAFSHSVFEPVEHRWGWGQYFGPPSTDGAWFELYRQMLVREQEDDSLLLCQAAPRTWFEHGQRIVVERAPTYFGPLHFTVESRAAQEEIRATIKPSGRKSPAAIFLRLRHPGEKPLRSVLVNGRHWTDFDPTKEWVRIPQPAAREYTIVARYDR